MKNPVFIVTIGTATDFSPAHNDRIFQNVADAIAVGNVGDVGRGEPIGIEFINLQMPNQRGVENATFTQEYIQTEIENKNLKIVRIDIYDEIEKIVEKFNWDEVMRVNEAMDYKTGRPNDGVLERPTLENLKETARLLLEKAAEIGRANTVTRVGSRSRGRLCAWYCISNENLTEVLSLSYQICHSS